MTGQRTSGSTSALVVAATVLAVAALAGCSTTRTDPSRVGQAPVDRPRPDGASARVTTPTAATEGVRNVQIVIHVGDERFTADLDDTPAGRDLLAQLPQTIEMRDHGGVEKTGTLQVPLSLDGQPGGADPDVGDLGYYAPGSDLVLYYGDQGYYDGIVILGRLDDGAPSRLAAMAGDITAAVSATDAP